MKELNPDVLVVGAGLAGCLAAIRSSELGAKTLLVEKQHIERSGEAGTGIDQLPFHPPGSKLLDMEINRQRNATDGLFDEYFARLVMQNSYEMTMKLNQWGVKIHKGGELLCYPTMWREQELEIEGLNIKRILYKACRRHRVQVLNRIMITDMLFNGDSVLGAAGFNTLTGQPVIIRAAATIITTGGCNRLYRTPTGHRYNRWRNPYMTGDGLAAGFRIGMKLKHMEFVMGTLVPKGYSAPSLNGFIGFGARLINNRGERIMERYSPNGLERSSRQLLQYAVYNEIEEGRGPVYLDCREINTEKIELLRQGFYNEKPPLVAYLDMRGIDLSREPLEIEVTEPYVRGTVTGGFSIDHRFRATYDGVFAAGEATAYDCIYSATGALVFGRLAAEEAMSVVDEGKKKKISNGNLAEVLERINAPLSRRSGISPEEAEGKLNEIMSRYVEYKRDEMGLTIALEELQALKREIDGNVVATDPLSLLRAHEVINMAELAICVAFAARERKESRMYLCHRRTDFPQSNDLDWKAAIVLQKSGEEIVAERIPY